MWIKTRYLFKEKMHIPKEEKYLSESSHEGEVARKGEDQRGNHGFRGRPSQHWMMVSIQARVSDSICQFLQILNFMLSLIVLSSITKKGEIVTNMAPFMTF